MAGHIPDRTLEEIRQRIDIVELIGSRIALKRAGSDFKACCPFHKEKTPSFIVSPARRSFHCFGCGAHGDIFKFLMMSDGMTFPDAVRHLAGRCGVELETTTDYEAAARSVLLRIHSDLAAHYRKCLLELPEAAAARAYLASRRLDGETAERFGIGYAPDRRGAIIEWAKANSVDPEQLVSAGVLSPPQEGRSDYYDRFHGRLMFPIRDATGHVVAFSGRILDKDAKAAKYVNSPETAIFRKGSILYALDFARQKIVASSRREALVCEGQIDVIRCHSAGFGNAVASQGTAFTEEHVRLLKRYADGAILVFDGDGAGAKAAVRTGRLFLAEGMPVQGASLPPGEDPDSLIRDKGPDAFRALIDKPLSLITYQARAMRAEEEDPDAIDARERITRQILETVASCSKAVMRSYLVQEASEALGVPIDAIQADIAEAEAKRNAAQGSRTPPPAATPQTAQRVATTPPRTQGAASPAGAKRRTGESPLLSLAAILVQCEGDEAIFGRVAGFLPPSVMGDSPEAAIASAALSDFLDGGEAIASLSENGDEAVRTMLESISTHEAKALFSKEISPVDSAGDLIARVWIGHLKNVRAALDISDEAVARRRLELTSLIKALETTRDWTARAALIQGEMDRMSKEPEEIA